jgi:hypothetical protein
MAPGTLAQRKRFALQDEECEGQPLFGGSRQLQAISEMLGWKQKPSSGAKAQSLQRFMSGLKPRHPKEPIYEMAS